MLSVGSALASQALTCAQLQAAPEQQNFVVGVNDYRVGVDAKAGDALTAIVDLSAYGSTNGLRVQINIDNGGSPSTIGTSNFIPAVSTFTTNAAALSADYFGLVTMNLSFFPGSFGVIGTVTLTCTPAPVSSGTDIDYIENGILKHATINATQMINNLVDAGVDAAFSAQAAQQTPTLGFTAGGIVVDATPPELAGSPFAIWSGVRYGLTPGDANNWSGMQVSGAAGVNYSATDALVLGVFGAYEASGYGLKANSQSFTGSGPTAGLVAAYRLGDNWRIEATGYASLLGYSIDDNGTTGKFGAVRYVLKGTLSGATPVNANIDFVPVASVSVLREDQAGYVDSAAGSHAGQTVLAAQGSAGGKFVFYPTNGLVSFWGGAYADYWLGDAFGGGLSGRVEAGTDIGFGDTGKLGVKVEASHVGTTAATYAASASVGGAL